MNSTPETGTEKLSPRGFIVVISVLLAVLIGLGFFEWHLSTEVGKEIGYKQACLDNYYGRSRYEVRINEGQAVLWRQDQFLKEVKLPPPQLGEKTPLPDELPALPEPATPKPTPAKKH